MRNFITAFFLSFLLSSVEALSLLNVSPVYTSPLIDVSRNEAVLDFPETATFKLDISGAAEIQSIILEYGSIRTRQIREHGMDVGDASERISASRITTLVALAHYGFEWQ